MSRLGSKSLVFHGDFFLGEVEISSNNQNFQFPNNEIRINHISQPSERCPPLSILQTISPFSVRCKLKSSSTAEKTHLSTLYFTCLNELKSAVVLLGGEELHLVAMPSKQEKLPCFWCCSVPMGIYGSILGMLNLRCLAIVFDLDETLIVANTMKSFEDRIEFLQKKLEVEHDPLRVSGMSAELRRYVEDRSLLKQYLENDNVIDNGKVFNIQFEEVQSLSNEQVKIVRPVIRLKERNIVLTRINPEIRDTSVLVRLRPAWEDLRSYLNAKGRKRFEVYVCTMAERDYALEMWRLLDPEAHLISPNQLLNRVVCVKSGARKSLSSVFQDGMCHPKMAMVIDDRLKVWEDNDQPRVHVVPAFTPYYAPQAETANAVPVLCVARNVACSVRAGYFKEYDENLLRRIFELCYEDEVANLPFSPDVSDFIMPEDTIFVPNGNRDLPIPEGMHGAEVERRMNKSNEMHTVDTTNPFLAKIPDSRPEASQQPVSISPPVVSSEASRINMPLQRSTVPEVESNPSEVDSDKRRRLLILQHGADFREPKSGAPSPPTQSSGGWLVDEDSTMDVDNNGASGLPQDDILRHKTETIPSEIKGEEPSLFADKEHGKVSVMPPYIFIGVLQEIGRRCGSKIEFRSIVSTSKDLQFSVEVLFSGEKIGIGMGKTKKDAQQQAAENALRTLADEYVAYIGPDSGPTDKVLVENNNGFLWDEPGQDEKNGNTVP